MIDIEVQLKSYLYRDGVMMFGGGSLSGETRQRVVEVMRVELLKRFWRYLGAI